MEGGSGGPGVQPIKRIAIDFFSYKGMVLCKLDKHDKLIWVCVVCQGNQATP